MTSTLDAAGSKELKQGSVKEESIRKLVGWLTIFAFGAGCVTVELIRDLHNGSNQVWFDLPILLTCLVFARNYAWQLVKKP